MGHRGVDPAGSAGGTRHRSAAVPGYERCTTMVIVSVFALLALFSILSIVLGAEDRDGTRESHENPYLWTAVGRP